MNYKESVLIQLQQKKKYNQYIKNLINNQQKYKIKEVN